MLEKTLLPAIISLVTAIITAYFTANITARVEVRKKLVESLVTQRFGKLLDELSQWVNRLRVGIPTPRDWLEGKDVTQSLSMIEEYDTWVTINIGNCTAFDSQLSEHLCVMRDKWKEYMSSEPRQAAELNEMYRTLIETHLSNLSKALVTAHRKAMAV